MSGSDDGSTTLARMEASTRDTLARRLANGPLPEPAAIVLARELADALRIAHAAGIFHSDLRPDHIFLEESRPKLVRSERLATGDADERSDIHALGCILFEMLAGHPPFTGDRDEAIAAPRAPASPALADLVAAMLAVRREERPPSMAAVVAALDACGRRPSLFDVVSAWVLLALPLLLLLYAIVVARHTSEDRPVTRPAAERR